MLHIPLNYRGQRLASIFAVANLALLAACASPPPPTEQMAVGKAAVERATGPAAAEAPAELAAARDKLASANAAYAKKDYVLAQAASKARLASAKAEARRMPR